MWEGFAQDSWKATQKLHVDYGVRYSVIVPYHALWGNMIGIRSELLRPGQGGHGVDPSRTGTSFPAPAIATTAW